MPWKKNYTISDEIGMRDADVRWPENRRCCFSITVDLSVASGPAGVTEADLLQPASHFGMNEGLQRTLDVLERFGRRATFVVPAAMVRIYADRVRDIARLGHEIAAGGYLHEDVTNLAPPDERNRIAFTTDVLTDLVGHRPRGWFSLPRQQDAFSVGTISPNTVDLLIEAGYDYLGNGLADDLPHYWVTDFDTRRSLLTLPYYYHFDDQYFLMFPTDGTGLERLNALQRNWMAEFKAQYRRGRYFGITLHPKGIGWGHRTIALEKLLRALEEYPDLWNATGSECTAHWSSTFSSETALHLEPSIWADYQGSLS